MRYLVLLFLCLPIVLLGLANIITNFKLKKISSHRFKSQLLIWLIILVILVGSFPVYNLITGQTIFNSKELSLFDIVQTSAIVCLLYIINNQRQRIDETEKRLRKLHQELSIKLSKD